MFQGREHMFKVCEHMFKGLEQKKYNMENKNPLSRKIKNNREAEKKLFLSLQRDSHQAYYDIVRKGAYSEVLQCFMTIERHIKDNACSLL